MTAPAVVTLHLWGVTPRTVPAAVVRMGAHRAALRRTPGLRFGKLLGTGHGRTFDVRDADPLHWGVLGAWDSTQDALAFDRGPVVASWDRIAAERLVVRMVPLTTTGWWSRHEPFGPSTRARSDTPTTSATPASGKATTDGTTTDGITTPHGMPSDGPVAAITRARLVPRRAALFWRSVPPVAADLNHAPGLRLALGIGEAPVGLQGTFSLWADPRALDGFVRGSAAHRSVVRRTAEVGWYAEELFARFAVRAVEGTFAGRQP